MTVPRGPAPPTGPEQLPDGAAYGAADDPAELLAKLGRSWTWILGSAVATLRPGAASRFVDPLAVLADFFPARGDEGRFRGVGMTSRSLGMRTTGR